MPQIIQTHGCRTLFCMCWLSSSNVENVCGHKIHAKFLGNVRDFLLKVVFVVSTEFELFIEISVGMDSGELHEMLVAELASE